MRQIHIVEQTGKNKFIAPFLEKQALICREFGIDLPSGCKPKYQSVEGKRQAQGVYSKRESAEILEGSRKGVAPHYRLEE